MKSKQVLSLSLALVSIGLVAPRSLIAQVTRGTISGVVTDPSGAAVPGAEITATNEGTGVKTTVSSSGSGDYTLTELDPAVYTLTAKAQGFATAELRGIRVDVAARLGINLALELAKGSTTVLVSEASAPLVETTNSTISGVVTQQQVVDLPLNGRDPYNLITLQPGITPDPIGRGEGVSSNGQRGASANYMLDGADNNAVGVTGFNTQIPVDSVQEFRVLENNYSAEFGRNTGFIADVLTKSGTNRFHGVAYDFLRNTALDSASFTNNATSLPKDVLRRNQFGGNAGGPIRRDKTFFFAAFEAIRVRPGAVAQNFLVPTPNFISSLPAGSFAAQVLAKYAPPIPNSGHFQDAFGNTTDAAGNPLTLATADVGQVSIPTEVGKDNTYYITSKIDHSFSNRDRLSGAFHFERDRLPFNGNISAYSAFNTGQVVDDRNFNLTYTHTFSASMINEARAGLNRGLNNFPVNTNFPNIFEDTLGVALPATSPADNLPQDFTENTMFASDLLSLIKGRSTYKMGGDYRRIRNGSVFAADIAGDYEFTALRPAAGAGPCDPNDPTFPVGCGFSNDSPGGFSISLNPGAHPLQPPEYYRGYRQNEFALFFQDDIKWSRRLTLNLGLRYEYFGVPHNFRQNIDSTILFGSGNNIFQREAGAFFSHTLQNPGDLKGLIWHKDKDNFAPRIGFAYDVFGDGKTSLRGGYGVGYDRLFNNVFENIRFNPPDFCFCSFGPFNGGLPFTYNPFNVLAGLPPQGFSTIPRASVRHMDQNLATSYAENWFFGIERQLPHDTVIKINYAGTQGVKLSSTSNINRSKSNHFVDPTSTARLNSLFSSDNFRSNDGHSTYHALQVELLRRFGHGLGLQASYTYSHALTNLSDTFTGAGGAGLGFTQAFNSALDKGNAAFDITHILVLNYDYQLPFFREQQGLKGHVLGGWSINGIITYRTGNPFTIIDTSDPNKDRVFNDRVNIVGSVFALGASRKDINGNPIVGGIQYLNPSAFQAIPHALDAAGGESQNQFHGPGSQNWDFSIHKDFRIGRYLGESSRLEYRAEFFNLFNHPNLGGPNNSVSATVNPDGSVTTIPGTVGQAFYGGNRVIQMALKLYF